MESESCANLLAEGACCVAGGGVHVDVDVGRVEDDHLVGAAEAGDLDDRRTSARLAGVSVTTRAVGNCAASQERTNGSAETSGVKVTGYSAAEASALHAGLAGLLGDLRLGLEPALARTTSRRRPWVDVVADEGDVGW
jgi:hypothetical protein